MYYANIIEMFSSLQGEGLYVGLPQLFIRLGGCNLRCTYCDTPEGFSSQKTGRIEIRPFSGKYLTLKNPVAAPALLAHVFRLIKEFPHYHSVSITGGEPLLHTDFLKAILPPIRKKLPILLETNGALPARLKEVIKLVDIVSMDIKLPSDLIAHHKDTKGTKLIDNKVNLKSKHWRLTGQFLRLAATKPASYIKIVVTGNTEKTDWLKARQIISKVKRNIPVVLQPVSVVVGLKIHQSEISNPHFIVKPVTYSKLLKVYEMMRQGGLTDVRIIPQVHRLMKWK